MEGIDKLFEIGLLVLTMIPHLSLSKFLLLTIWYPRWEIEAPSTARLFRQTNDIFLRGIYIIMIVVIVIFLYGVQ